MDKILIIGGGLLGLSSARALSDRGREVEVIEAREEVGLETSYANGGLLTPSMPEPWNAPGVYRHLAASLFNPSAPMKLRPGVIPSLFSWGLRFLRNSSRSRFTRTLLSNYRLASYSVTQTAAWREALGLQYDAGTTGTLKVCRDASDMAVALELAETLAPLGLRFERLDVERTLACEPALEGIREQLVGGLRFPDDETGDAHLFCRALAASLQSSGIEVRTGLEISGLIQEKGSVTGVQTQAGDIRADSVVLCCGIKTPALLKPLGLSLPIAPVKGYSVTFQTAGVEGVPKLPVIDDAMHAAITPLGDRLRAVGTAEFAGFDTRLSKVRVDNLVRFLKELYPHIAAGIDLEAAEPWTHLRPMSCDAKPFIGASRIPGLYINAGHGQLGWTKAAGSACLLADLMLGRAPAIDDEPFRVHR